ncbi:hypothetical protein Ancab_016723 [Ancistrocladus abbreviatus]
MARRVHGAEIINEDTLQHIFTKLPAKSFAYVACVCRSWRRVCNRILSKPRLRCAMSLAPNTRVAVEETVNKVLSEPIRPQFVIASLTLDHNLAYVHALLKEKFGSVVPIVTNVVEGVIGVDTQRNVFLEATVEDVENEKMEKDEREEEEDVSLDYEDDLQILGFVLIIGWMPDMKVEAIPLISSSYHVERMVPTVNKFYRDIKEYTWNVSDSPPAAVILFGEREPGFLFHLLHMIDHAFTMQTAIVGHMNGFFEYQSAERTRNARLGKGHCCRAVALTFARARNKPADVGTTQFHVPYMNCVTRIGPTFTVTSVDEAGPKTYLLARREDSGETVNGSEFIDLLRKVDERTWFEDVYIEVEKKRGRAKKTEPETSAASLLAASFSLHALKMEACLDHLAVRGSDIKEGDTFNIYRPDFTKGVFLPFEEDRQNDNEKQEVFGGMVFVAQSNFSASLIRNTDVYSNPFLEQFLVEVPLGGMFSKKVVKHGLVRYACRGREYCHPNECHKSSKGPSFLIMSYNSAPNASATTTAPMASDSAFASASTSTSP